MALWTAEVGGLNAASHLWVYDSLAHRAEVRASMAKDTKLAELRGNGVQSLSTQSSVILNAAPFSPLR